MTSQVYLDGDFIVFKVPKYLNHLPKSCGARWSPKEMAWKAKATKIAAAAVLANFTKEEYDPQIAKICGETPKIEPLLIHPNSVIKGVTLKPRQLEGIEKAWSRPGFAFFWVMGCVSGDTEIQCLLGAGKGKKITIEKLYARNGLRTRARCLKGDQFGQHEIEEVIYSGIKFTYTLTLSDGKSIRATKDHKILTADGWKNLGSLIPGDEVIVNGGIHPLSRGKIVVVPKKSIVVSVIPFGEEPTYDVCMKDPYHNFVANGIVVHNSGKTLSTISLAGLRYATGMIEKMVIICPTSVIGVWIKEYARYSGVPHHIQAVYSGGKLKPWEPDKKHILLVGIEALSQGGAFDVAMNFIRGNKTLTVIDESSLIKNYDAIRTKRCIDIGESSDFRLILTGTNVTQGLQDLYSQMYFIDPTAIGEVSFFSFRNKYCRMGGFEARKIVGYDNTKELFDRIRPFCDVVKKVEGLPDRSYQIREVKVTPDQTAACKELIAQMKAELEGKDLQAKNILEANLRLQQVAGGHLPDGTRLSSIPKLTELMAIIEEYDGKVIIWARFLPEIHTIAEQISKVHGPGSVIKIFGEVLPEDRQKLVDKFQSDPEVRFVIANQATARMGLTMTAARLSVYYSNTFSLEDRLQSECRNYRIGQEHRVNYIDLMSNIKVDRSVVAAIEYKREVANYATEELAKDVLVNLSLTKLEDLL